MTSLVGKYLANNVLERSKKVYDAVHGFIRFNALEKLVIDSEPFQRLHGIHQLGIAYLVYPGATHTRFEHSLGTMHLASQIFDRLCAKGFIVDHASYWEQIVRFAALCHDMGHLPFSHDAEHELLGAAGHEEWTVKVIGHLQPIWDQVSDYFPGRNIKEDIIKMAIGEKKLSVMGKPCSFSAIERVLSQIVTGDFFGADRIDYLLRDAQCTGVSHGFFDYLQLIEMLCVAEIHGRLEMCIEENGVESCEALLLARHFMHKRVYKYPSVKLYKFHLASFMRAFFAGERYLDHLEDYLSLTDHEIIAAFRKAAKNPADKGHEAALCLMDRKKRFRTLCIAHDFDAPLWRSALEQKGVVWIEPVRDALQELPTFFVRTASLKVEPSSTFCQVSLSPKKERLLYVHPDYEAEVKGLLHA